MDVEHPNGEPVWTWGLAVWRWRCQVELIAAISYLTGEGDRHPAAAIEVGTVPSKISPVVAYIVSMAVQLHSCTEVTPVSRNGSAFLWAAVSSITG